MESTDAAHDEHRGNLCGLVSSERVGRQQG
jgi:hypothetical protein